MIKRKACTGLSCEKCGANLLVAQRMLAYAAHMAPVASRIPREFQLPFHKMMPKNVPMVPMISIME